MAEATQQPIVVKRIKKGGGGAHGGAWKIAYADFVTAMMAFFLLMWLLGSTTEGDLKGISDYFQAPLKMSMQGGRGTGDATSVIPGGGNDLTKSVGQVANADYDEPKKRMRQPKIVAADNEALERVRFEEMKQKLEAIIEASPLLRPFAKQLLLDITSEGLRIQIVDEKNRPMFDSGGAALKPYTREILQAIAQTLNDVGNRISVSGHTDATPYAADRGFGNWELSADRANACRREMVMGGLPEERIARVVGLAATIPLKADDPYDAINRRISIVVLNKRTEESLVNAGRTLDVSNAAPSAQQIQQEVGGIMQPAPQ
ncbi:flagellar motor protein MotB [Niveibacterium sp. 24ML]|uniref:flagellar motor protein MotB n=1 Tax=Niveibacterium sp. 24ML TaxID=2985512 RepID=UPI002271EBA7|nr:flagellar motor protein MotB [Niveibacterium sp. 24ML]MCX9158329.1 flagellar motor protein MotB [Niveibacterium sp. 24ML]